MDIGKMVGTDAWARQVLGPMRVQAVVNAWHIYRGLPVNSNESVVAYNGGRIQHFLNDIDGFLERDSILYLVADRNYGLGRFTSILLRDALFLAARNVANVKIKRW